MTVQIAIIGAGVMGETLLTALLRSGRPVDEIVICEKRAEQAAVLRAKHGVAVLDNVDAAQQARTILIVVKPQDMAAVLAEIGPVIGKGSTVMSLAAGIHIDVIEDTVAADVAVIRVMPNTPALVGEGMFGMSPGKACSDEQLTAAKKLLETSGKVVIVPEELQDAVTGLSGSGPAYIFYLAESMIAGGIAAGLPETTAGELAIQTIVGAAKMLSESDATPAVLRERVTSPNGTTAAALSVLDTHDVKGAIKAAIIAASDRSAELST